MTNFRHELGAAALTWWRSLDKDRRGRAELRRASSRLKVFEVPAFYDLRAALRKTTIDGMNFSDDGVARVAATLAQVREHVGQVTLGEHFGASLGERPRVSEFRFRRILSTDGSDAFLPAMRRLLQAAGSSAPVPDLATTCLWWTDNSKKQLAIDYYAAAPNRKKDK